MYEGKNEEIKRDREGEATEEGRGREEETERRREKRVGVRREKGEERRERAMYIVAAHTWAPATTRCRAVTTLLK